MAATRPNYSYTGSNELKLENHPVGQVYVLYLKASGTLYLQNDYRIDLCLCGGGRQGKYGEKGSYNSTGNASGGGSIGIGGVGGAGGAGAQVVNRNGITIARGSYASTIAAQDGTTAFLGSQARPDASAGGVGGGGGVHGSTFPGWGPGGGNSGAIYAKPGSSGAVGAYAFGENLIRLGGGGGGGGGGGSASMSDAAAGGTGSFNGGDGGGQFSYLGNPAKGYGGGGGGGGGGSGGSGVFAGGAGGAGIVIIRFLNQSPTNPQNIATTGNQAGQPAISTVTASTDADNDTIQYVWEQRTDTSAFAQIGITDLPTITYNVPEIGTTFTRRCKAVDSQGGESAYATGADMAINYNFAPEISGQNIDLGTFQNTAPTWNGTASDQDGDTITVTTKLKDTLLKTQVGKAVDIDVNLADLWIRIANGEYTISIVATDTKGASATRTLTFTKRENQFEFYRGQSTYARPHRFNFNLSPPRSTWRDATVQFWATNNGNDPVDEIVWLEIPAHMIGDSENPSSTILMDNMVKSAEFWAFAVHGKATEGASGQPVVLKSMQISVSAEPELETLSVKRSAK